MASFYIVMKDETGRAREVIDASIRNAEDWSRFWGNKTGPISRLWAKSRMQMFATEGASTGPRWPEYTYMEKRFYLPIKRWLLDINRGKSWRATMPKGSLLRWTSLPSSPNVAPHERLYPSLCIPSHPEYIFRSKSAGGAKGNGVVIGTAVPYAVNHDQGRGEWKRRPRKNTILGKRDAKGQMVVSVKTPKRPLMRFGDTFTMGVRDELKRTAVAQGGKVGIVSTEMQDRFAIAQGINANR
jgi:hypothetical protein